MTLGQQFFVGLCFLHTTTDTLCVVKDDGLFVTYFLYKKASFIYDDGECKGDLFSPLMLHLSVDVNV